MASGLTRRPRVWIAGAIIGFLIIDISCAVRHGPQTDQSDDNETKETSQRLPGFCECATDVGIRFRMAFLPGEQGAKFKVNLYDHGCGVAVGDFDGDGFDDIYFVNQLGPNALYRNNGDGTFTDVTEKAGVGVGDRVCVGAVFCDYDNDGYPDLFVTTTRGGNILFHNNGNGTFTDVTSKAGVGLIAHAQTAVFFDYDNDGYPDLFVTNTAHWTQDTSDPKPRYFPGVGSLFDLFASPKEYNVLYHNNGNGTFTDVTEQAGLAGPGWGGDVAVFDYDEDGWLDLLVTNMFGRSRLYHNNRNGTFTDVTAQTLKRTSFGAIGSKVFDFDNDGKLDLLLVDMHSDMWMAAPGADLANIDPGNLQLSETVKYRGIMGPVSGPTAEKYEKQIADRFQIKYDEVIFGNTLFKNLGGGQFEEVSEKAGLETLWPWGIAVGDFNNDGFEDVFLPSGMGYPFPYWPNYLMMNQGNGTFANRARAEGIEPPVRGQTMDELIGGRAAARSSRCAAVADFTHTGRLDIVTNNFNDQPYFFKNQFPRRNYIAFRLSGTKCNRDAIGAVVRLHMGREVMVRQVQAAGGYLSQSSNELHFGLGDRDKVDLVEIRWPGGDRPQRIENPDLNKQHRIKEPAK
jgi:hypothetical protein